MIPLRVENPSSKFPFITIIIILSNVAVYTYQLSLGSSEQLFIWKYGAIAKSLTSFVPVHPASTLFPPLTLITSMFLHGSILHLAGNMLFFWVFGENIEDKLGHIKFIIFYLLCGVASLIVQVVSMPSAELPIIGASGAIAGIMGAYFLRFPRTKVITLIVVIFIIRTVKIPAVVFLGFWFIFQILVGAPTLGSTGGGVAYFAHIGGFVSGMIFFAILEKHK
ncbi:MAG: rhomboid family intramembrane serine protease [candidate division Zixibacteria bacterium]|nr:rhomboid family intramembrane serine protease [candidate division Zixibacteria bacterium]